MFDCKACKARGEEIDHLRAIIAELQIQLQASTARVMELAQPGIERRIQTPPPRMPQPPVVPQVNPREMMPGYEWRPEEPRTVIDESES